MTRLLTCGRLHPTCSQAVTMGDLHAVAATCPLLEHVTIGARDNNGDYAVVGPALLPLRALRHLVSLELHSITFPHGHLGFGASLAALTQLQRLVVQDWVCWRYPHRMPGRLRPADLLPHLQALTNLRCDVAWDPWRSAACLGPCCY